MIAYSKLAIYTKICIFVLHLMHNNSKEFKIYGKCGSNNYSYQKPHGWR